MLDTLTLIGQRDLPVLPEPRLMIKEKMLALAALIDAPVDLWPHRTGILPAGCWWLPSASLALYGTACVRPLMFDEVRDISRATGLSGIVVRYSDTAGERTRISFDVYHDGAWRARHLLWIGAEDGPGWLLPDLCGGPYLRLSQWGVDVHDEPPFLDLKDRIDGLERGTSYLSSFVRWR
jgi:hypothetical protein